MEVPACLSLVVTIGLVLARPRFGRVFRVGPAIAALVGVLVMLACGVVDRADLTSTVRFMARPLAAIGSIMITADVARRVGVMSWLAGRIEAKSGAGATRLFAYVYALGALTAAVLNNDSAVLLLSPIVVALARKRFPAQPKVIAAFALAVFMSAGVAPLVVSNPMNMIVASYAHIDFNGYARVMGPIAIAGWAVGFVVLRLSFAKVLRKARPTPFHVRTLDGPPTGAQLQALALLAGVLAAYPIVAYLGGPVWLVAAGGGVLALVLARVHRAGSAHAVLAEGVSWNILAFLVAVSVLGAGLRNAGITERLAAVYAHGGAFSVAGISALGSAAVNNHPMSILNMMAVHGDRQTLAALIGGDLGPRLLPMGSLAGLLWFDVMRRQEVEVAPLTFARVGLLVTVPTLAVSLGLLYLLT